jgi:small GTP-binding protein
VRGSPGPVEFTLRAFLRGRLDLTQAEAVADLVHAETTSAGDLALAQLAGALSERLRAIEERLADAAAEVEARVDFAEDVGGVETPPHVREAIVETTASLDALLAGAPWARAVREGVRVPIVGRPRRGKSSLFNALLGEERAIVTEEPGTTRDRVSERIELAGVTVTLSDTAGVRMATNPVEAMGVARALATLEGAAVVMWVIDASQPFSADGDMLVASLRERRVLVVLHKSDLESRVADADVLAHVDPALARLVRVSSATGEGHDALRASLAELLGADRRGQPRGGRRQPASCRGAHACACLARARVRGGDPGRAGRDRRARTARGARRGRRGHRPSGRRGSAGAHLRALLHRQMNATPEPSSQHYAPSPGAPREALPASADGAATREGRFDVVVVGAGHAGCEAAHACARMGLVTALLTVQVTDTAKMSCNPAIGGVAKGHMVRELDALGGVMGRVTDRAGIQFKMLNRGRGPAVWSPRAQCDKALYSAEMLRLLGATAGLVFVEGIAQRVRVVDGRAAGVELTDGRVLAAAAVIITPGTFLDGVLHIGERRLAGGRLGEHAARALSECLAELGFERGRLKTGTPPRLHRASIDYAALELAPGDDPPEPFSHWTERLDVEQVACWTTHTNARTHAVIRDNMARSPLYSGAITGSGPRYCPSLEDKVVKFPERTQHHLFLEPEGRDVDEIYVNGVSTSMPEEVQLAFIRTIAGLERATMIRPGYAVEYDFVLPHQLDATLQSRRTPGLWLAGRDLRHIRLRGGRGAGLHRGRERRACGTR